MKNKSEIVSWEIPKNRFDNENFFEERLSKVPDQHKTAVGHVLRYLYSTDGKTNLTREVRKIADSYFDAAEIILVHWLFSRTNGSLRKRYGKESLIAARNAGYRCSDCGHSDVRTLQLDHTEGHESKLFQCLCANCHQIKSRLKDYQRAA